MPSEACAEEFETLTAIFLDEITINDTATDGSSQVSMVLYPATADDEESRYVTLTLELFLSEDYPKIPPKIVFRNPRGLNESMLDELMMKMKERCEDRLESQMVYELIDMGKEFLTKNNRPASECPICLLSFTEFDVFFRTRCFHHFHSYCLGKYLQNCVTTANDADNHVHQEKLELTCPVCREILEEVKIEKLLSAPPPSEEFETGAGESSIALKEWEDKKRKMKTLFEKQKSQGGIIDLTESKKLLVISTRESDLGSSSSSTNDSAVPGTNATAQRPNTGDSSAGQSSTGRQRNNDRYQILSHSQHNHSTIRRSQTESQSAATGGGTGAGSVATKSSQEVVSSETKNNSKNTAAGADTKEKESKSDHQSNGHYHRRFKGGGSHNRRRNK